MRKVYEYRNKAQAELVVTSPSGKTRFKYKFTGGVMDPKNKIHAKHTTDNVIMQQALENSEYFNKSVFLVASFGTAPIAETMPVVRNAAPTQPAAQPIQAQPKTAAKKTAKTAKAVEAPETEPVQTVDNPEDEVRTFEDVTNLGAAISILMSEGGVDGADVTTIEGVLKAAKEKNISFPNLK